MKAQNRNLKLKNKASSHICAFTLESEVSDDRRIRSEILRHEQGNIAHVLHFGELGRVVYLA